MSKTTTLNELNLNPEKIAEELMNKHNNKRIASPSEQVLQNIFNFARALNVITTQSAGKMNIILN